MEAHEGGEDLKGGAGGDLGAAQVLLVQGVVVRPQVIEDGAALDALEGLRGRPALPSGTGLGLGGFLLLERPALLAAAGQEEGAQEEEREGANEFHRKAPF